MKIIGIETSCDETAASLLLVEKNRFSLRKNVVSSQIDIHAKYGGVVPEIAAREHIQNIIPIIEEVLFDQGRLVKPDLIAVTEGPGLITSLMVGVQTAKTLGFALNVPVAGVNHIKAHIYANWLDNDWQKLKNKDSFPLIALVVSGGHTEIILMKDENSFKKIGSTLDDAAGESFDKVAKMMKLGYPGGPIISRLAEKGNPEAIKFPRPMMNQNNFNFSFAGLKTAVLYFLREKKNLSEQDKADVAAAFQAAVVEVLINKTIRAAKKFKVKNILLAGGVSANKRLRSTFAEKIIEEFAGRVKFWAPEFNYCTDNAAMVAIAGYFIRNKKCKIKIDPNLSIMSFP